MVAAFPPRAGLYTHGVVELVGEGSRRMDQKTFSCVDRVHRWMTRLTSTVYIDKLTLCAIDAEEWGHSVSQEKSTIVSEQGRTKWKAKTT